MTQETYKTSESVPCTMGERLEAYSELKRRKAGEISAEIRHIITLSERPTGNYEESNSYQKSK